MTAVDHLSYTGANPAAANVLGKYRLLAELGRGGMSEVFLASVAGPGGFNKLVVVKQIKNELAEDPDFVTMFLEEARLASRLSHPNIVQTNEVGEVGGRYFIAMEYLEGQPYSRILNRLGRDRGLPLGMSLRVLCDVLAGLNHAHELRDYDGTQLEVVHRDVTPHNVFVTYDGQIKLVDFGIAKAMNSQLETRTGVLKGKVGYMSPEQARGERVDCRADVFSVGVMIWEAAVGRRLWKGLSEVAVLHRLLSGEIPRPRDMRPDISPELDAICMRALAIDRDHRYPSAAALQEDLERLIEGPGQRNAAREVGRVIADAFSDDRERLRQIVEGQLSQANMLATGLYHQVNLPVLDSSISSRSGSLPDDSNPMPYTPSDQYPMYAQSGAQSVRPPVVGQSATTLTAGATSTSTKARPRSKLPIALLGLGAIAGGVAAAAWITSQDPVDRGATSTVEAAAKPEPEPTADTTAEPAVLPPIELIIHAQPAGATITIDGEAVANPFRGNLPRGVRHVVRVEAAGHQPQTKIIKYTDEDDAEQLLTVELETSATADDDDDKDDASSKQAPVYYQKPPPSTKDDDGDQDMKPPTKVPTVELDPSNPYGNN